MGHSSLVLVPYSEVDNLLYLCPLLFENALREINITVKPRLFCKHRDSEVSHKRNFQIFGVWVMSSMCSCRAACARVDGIAHCVLGLLRLRSMCWGCWDHTACARVAGVAQRGLGLLGLHSVCRGHWGHPACEGVAGITQRVPKPLGSYTMSYRGKSARKCSKFRNWRI